MDYLKTTFQKLCSRSEAATEAVNSDSENLHLCSDDAAASVGFVGEFTKVPPVVSHQAQGKTNCIQLDPPKDPETEANKEDEVKPQETHRETDQVNEQEVEVIPKVEVDLQETHSIDHVVEQTIEVSSEVEHTPIVATAVEVKAPVEVIAASNDEHISNELVTVELDDQLVENDSDASSYRTSLPSVLQDKREQESEVVRSLISEGIASYKKKPTKTGVRKAFRSLQCLPPMRRRKKPVFNAEKVVTQGRVGRQEDGDHWWPSKGFTPYRPKKKKGKRSSASNAVDKELSKQWKELVQLHREQFKVKRRDLCFTGRLGSGANGAVYLCKDVTSKDQSKRYAVKVVDFEYCTENCLMEIRHLMAANCKYVVRFEGLCEIVDTTTWLLMEHCAGGSLHDITARSGRALTVEQVRVVAACVTLGLRHLHSLRIMHRDVKPANIMIGADGRAKLGDFGSSGPATNLRDTVIGTPLYMAPETLQMGFPYGPECDIWSLGISLIELASGTVPYEWLRDKPMAVYAILSNPPATLEHPEEYEQALNDFIADCLVKNAKERKPAEELLNNSFVKATVEDLEGPCYLTFVLKELLEEHLMNRVDETKVISRDAGLPLSIEV